MAGREAGQRASILTSPGWRRGEAGGRLKMNSLGRHGRRQKKTEEGRMPGGPDRMDAGRPEKRPIRAGGPYEPEGLEAAEPAG